MASGYSDLSEISKNGRSFGAYPKPPKINLLNEQPRRESLVEQHLTSSIERPEFGGHYSRVDHQQQVKSQLLSSRSQESIATASVSSPYYSDPSNSMISRSGNYASIKPISPTPGGSNSMYGSNLQNASQYQHQLYPATKTVTTTTRTINTTEQPTTMGLLDLATDLAEKEAKLKREIAYLNQHNNPWSRPRQIREPRREPPAKAMRNDQRWVRECPTTGPSSRPTSRASSTRSTTEADLLEKAEKLLQDVEELERKPLKTQQILIESGARRSASPSSSPSDQGQGVSSIHTAIIKVPRGEIDNKSPLPFAFDNFSTLGVRGNIASVGASEPEKPYPPIFPMIKRTPSPIDRRK